MTLQQLQALVAVVDAGGIRAAAKHLHLSQAAVTKSMRLLEAEAGVPLLVRRSRGVDLTEAGQRLLARARLVGRQVELAREELGQASGDDCGSVRVGVTPFLALTVLGDAFRWFRERYRNVAVELSEGLMSRALPRLRDGTLDIAVVAADVGELHDAAFNTRRILQARQRIAVRTGHPVLAAASAQALADLEWVLTHPGAEAAYPDLTTMFMRAGAEAPRRVVVCDTLAALALLRSSDAVGVVPEPLLGHPETRGIVAIDDCPLVPSDIELLLLSRPDVPLTPAAAYFAHCLAEVSRNARAA